MGGGDTQLMADIIIWICQPFSHDNVLMLLRQPQIFLAMKSSLPYHSFQFSARWNQLQMGLTAEVVPPHGRWWWWWCIVLEFGQRFRTIIVEIINFTEWDGTFANQQLPLVCAFVRATGCFPSYFHCEDNNKRKHGHSLDFRAFMLIVQFSWRINGL